MQRPNALYAGHVRTLDERYGAALGAAGFKAALVGAGLPVPVHRDDQEYPYRPEPLFLQWAPLIAHPGSCLLIRPGRTSLLLVNAPDDFWHQPAPVPKGPWQHQLDIQLIKDRREIRKHLPRRVESLALLGEPRQWHGLGVAGRHNPRPVMDGLDYDRAFKTPWEVECIRRATGSALAGHRAVEAGFRAGLSEHELGLMFLAGSGQTDAELPYPAIVAMNRNGATLHYQHRQRLRPRASERRSLLLDAGCSAQGYASDITRTYPARRGEFATLVRDLDREQQQLCAAVRPGAKFPELQLSAHQAIARVLNRAGLVRMEPDDMVRHRLTDLFLPHGLGHLLGLQVHDVGGELADRRGRRLPGPARFPRLRLRRDLAPGMVITIEPGLYFIDSLLARLRAGRYRRQVDWRRIAALRPCGGIRIEDNVLVTGSGHRNLTRELLLESHAPKSASGASQGR
jgi:Xaa-Pro dipeptidase